MMESQKRAAVDNALNVESGVITVAPATGATAVRGKMDVRTICAIPAGAAYLEFPYPQDALIGELYDIYFSTDAGGAITIVDPADNDLVGDDATAVADQVVMYSNGSRWIVLKDVTT